MPNNVVFDAQAEEQLLLAEFPPFTFKGVDGDMYELPNMMTLDGKTIKRLNAALTNVAPDGSELQPEEADELMRTLLAELNPDAYEAIDAMKLGVQVKLIRAWTNEMDDSGKSDTPPSPSNRAERRSKQTSKSKGSKSKG